MTQTMLVVPSCRPDSLAQFFRAWEGRGGWDSVCVIEDKPERTAATARALPGGSMHYSHAEIKDVLGDDSWIISQRDSACRCFGFLVAHHAGADVLTLDDDCRPISGSADFVGRHRMALVHQKWTESIIGMRTRGLPYRNLGELRAMANVGLWTNNPDLDGPQGLLTPMAGFIPPSGTRIIPHGQYVPTCGMNLFICREALPLFFFPMMGQGWPYRRFDDIAAGIIAKRCMDVLGWRLSVGEPHVEHLRASDPFKNLIAEAPGIKWNEDFWELVDGIPFRAADPIECMRQVGAGLGADGDEYHRKLGQAIGIWASLFTETAADKWRERT